MCLCALKRDPAWLRGVLCSVTPASHAVGFGLCQQRSGFRKGEREGGGDRRGREGGREGKGKREKGRKVQREDEPFLQRYVRSIACDPMGVDGFSFNTGVMQMCILRYIHLKSP